MKTARRLTAVVMATLFALSLGAGYSAAQDRRIPTKQELTALLQTAKEPGDHLRIASYYKQEASRLSAEVELHRAWASIYGKGYGLVHCDNLASLNARAAKEATALAAMHESLAKTGEHKPR